MSCLLLKTTSGNLQKEVIKATHEEIIGGKRIGLLEGGSCWSMSDQPSCLVHGDRREGGGSKDSGLSAIDIQQGIWKFRGEEVQTAVCKPKNSHKLVLTDPETASALTKTGCHSKQQQTWQDNILDELVCKLVSQLDFYPETSISCSEKGEYQELSLQENDLLSGKNSTSSLEAKISKVATSTHLEESEGSLSLAIGLSERAVSSIDCHEGPPKLKSALRGGYEESGLGHRQQMHVTWAPDVYDPPCTSTSHTVSQYRRRHHHHPKGEHKGRHRGKGHTDSQKKSQKKLMRRLKHPSEIFSGGSTLLSQRGQQSSALMRKEYIAPSFDGRTLNGPKVSPFISLQKACFLSPVLALSECELVTLDKIKGCQGTHVQTNKLLV